MVLGRKPGAQPGLAGEPQARMVFSFLGLSFLIDTMRRLDPR